MDFWKEDHKAVLHGPTFSEDCAFRLIDRMTMAFKRISQVYHYDSLEMGNDLVVKEGRVIFTLRGSAVMAVKGGDSDGIEMDESEQKKRARSPLFFCLVTNTRAEFLYQTRKVSRSFNCFRSTGNQSYRSPVPWKACPCCRASSLPM